ncbi:MAG TPA: PDZ domain-containing protein, partial [Gemmataceae bacterium]|nr:PDZ domain-containing protein [Gemmataceae bacterium]
MFRRVFSSCLVVFTFAGLAALSRPAEPSKPARADASPKASQATPQTFPEPPFSCARRAWAISSVVLDNHVDPPTRQEMFLAGAKALLKAADSSPPAGLSRRVSALTTEQEFATFLGDIWPKSRALGTELEAAMLRGLLDAVPGSPELLSAKELQAINQFINNRYVGTGIQIRKYVKEDLTQIVVTFPDSPARRAGVLPDDLILEVDHVSVRGAGLSKVVDRLRGAEGRPVSMLVRQPGASQSRLIKMTRAVIPFETVVGFRRNPDETWQWRVDPAVPIAYVRVTSLTTSCLHELRKVEARLRAEGDRALVLDLRFNADGDMHPAALVADGLLESGVLWRVRDARNKVKEYRADPECLFRDWP